jgi:hypothetical protein
LAMRIDMIAASPQSGRKWYTVRLEGRRGYMGSATAAAAIFAPQHAVTLQRDAGSCAPAPPVGMACWCSVENRIVLTAG